MRQKVLTPVFQDACVATARTFGENHGLRVVFQGADAKTDNKTIYLPSLPTNVELDVDQQEIGAGYLDHETDHVLYTDMDVYQKAIIARGNDPLFASTLNFVEDVRVEALGTAKYPGTRKNLTAVTRAVDKATLKEIKGKTFDDLRQFGGAALAAEGRRRLGISPDTCEKVLEHCSPGLAAKARLWADAIEHLTSTADAVALADQIVGEMNKQPQPPPPTPKPKPSSGGNEGQPKEGKNEDDGDDGVFENNSSAPPAATLPPPFNPDRNLKKLLGIKEADKTAYVPWSTEYDLVVGKGHDNFRAVDASEYQNLVANSAGRISVMRRKLQRALLAKLNRDWDRGREIGVLDTKRLVRAYQGHPNVYKVREPAPDLDTACTLLIDCSGSMSGAPIRMAAIAAICLAEAIEPTGVALEVLGYTSHNWNGQPGARAAWHSDRDAGGRFSRICPVWIFEFKPFARKLAACRAEMAAIPVQWKGNNVDGESVVKAWIRLSRRPERRKVMMVLSDGLPAFTSDFPGHNTQHLRDAVDYVTRKGATIVGIGIKTDYPSHFYPKWTHIQTLDELGEAPMDHIAKLLLGERFQIDNSKLMQVSS